MPVFVDYARDMARFRYFFTALPVLLSIFVFLYFCLILESVLLL